MAPANGIGRREQPLSTPNNAVVNRVPHFGCAPGVWMRVPPATCDRGSAIEVMCVAARSRMQRASVSYSVRLLTQSALDLAALLQARPCPGMDTARCNQSQDFESFRKPVKADIAVHR